ncbi:hypothetical protein SBP18_03330 [Rhodoferax ferrireducens]|uniref:hypothetical protein n=1 Tax=Rhodoferax ferrireducens TaxID=192843 RepID=UPI00298E1B1C|nr:hypothetical protein [Rhodoferax ferrireducens]WPC67550.1 hypothetical protein SBP18_03330 [Rhodoferax ferrireducens]
MNFEQFVLGHDPTIRLGFFTPVALGVVLIGWGHTPNALSVRQEELPLRLAEFEARVIQGGMTAWRAKGWPVAIH